MRRIAIVGLVFSAAACTLKKSTTASDAPTPAAAADVASVVDVDRRPGAWESDSRWTARVGEIQSAASPSIDRIRADLGVSFERTRRPIVEFDDAAPVAGDVVLRLVDGVRRPVVRLRPSALLSGEFQPEHDLEPLLVAGAMLSAAGERRLPTWTVSGVPLVVGDAFDRAAARRALDRDDPVASADAFFGAGDGGRALAAGCRARAVARCARMERPFARLLEALLAGKSEDAALAEIGVGQRALLDAAAATEESRAVRAFAGDAAFQALCAARARLAQGDAERADSALAPSVAHLDDVDANAWVAADARLCLADIAVARGETKNVKALLDAATASGKVVRVKQARVVSAWLAARSGGGVSALRTLLTDFPDVASTSACASMLGLPDAVTTKSPDLAGDVLSRDASKRQSAAVRLGGSGVAECATAVRLLASDADAPVRRAAVAALAVLLGRAADDEVEAATRDVDATVRRTALDLLAVSDKQRAAKRAAEMKSDSDAGVRARAAELSRSP